MSDNRTTLLQTKARLLADIDRLNDVLSQPCISVPSSAASVWSATKSVHGIDTVIVNGVVTVRNGAHTGAHAGRALFGPGYKK